MENGTDGGAGRWVAYLDALARCDVAEEKRRWYVRWVERFAAFLGGRPLETAERADVEAFMMSLSGGPRTETWQVRQASDAVRILLVMVLGKRWGDGLGTNVTDPGEVQPGDPLYPIRTVCRARHYSPRTEQTYIHWVRRFLAFCRERGGGDPGADECRAFLEHLVIDGKVAAATQAQALNALVFWFTQVRGEELGQLGDFAQSKRARRLPVVLTRDEVRRLLAALEEDYSLMAGLLYGAGLRLSEVCGLRVKDIDFGARQVVVRNGKGGKDRITVLPERYRQPLLDHLERVRRLHAADLALGYAGTIFWPSLERKYPKAPHRAGTPRTRRRVDDDDLHPRAEPTRAGRQEPSRPGVTAS